MQHKHLLVVKQNYLHGDYAQLLLIGGKINVFKFFIISFIYVHTHPYSL